MNGKIVVCGIGPGSPEKMTFEVQKVLNDCDIICGYKTYIDLIKDFYPQKKFLSSPMTKEEERCRMAFLTACEGKSVAFICSGDSGVYGLAGLLLEMQGEYKDVEVSIVPGVTAALSGAALLGSPLTNDFCCISLSNRLTPWSIIEKRLKAAAEGDFAIVLYNPCSKGRKDTLKNAVSILLSILPEDRPCGFAQNIGRSGENCGLLTLGELKDFCADMFTSIFIGNSKTKIVNKKLVTPRGYSFEGVND